MKLGEKNYTLSPEDADDDGKFHVSMRPASQNAVYVTLAANENDEDGRSEWLWIWLPNGDLILGVYPQGETYFGTERDHGRHEGAEPVNKIWGLGG